jgi:hypothetical protein
VWDSYFESGCNPLEFGAETAGDFHNVNFWNIGIGRAGKAAISITSCDGSVIDGINYNHIDIKGACYPIYMLVINRPKLGVPGHAVGAIKNVHIMNVTITGCKNGPFGPLGTSTLCGSKDSSIENVTLENVAIHDPGGETDVTTADVVPPYPENYQPKSLGKRPASGLYVRDVKGLTLKNVELTCDQPDVRPSLIVSDTDGLTLDNFKTQKSVSGESLRLIQVKNYTVQNSPDLPNRTVVTMDKGGE